MARCRSSGWCSSPAPYAQPAARPLPEDSREARPWRARRGSRPRLRWPGQRRGRWRPRLARRRPWLGRQPDGTCPPAPPPRPARRSSLLAGVMRSCVGQSRALLCPPLAAANDAAARAGQGPRPAHGLKTWFPPFPPPGGKAGLRPPIDAIPGTRPGLVVPLPAGTGLVGSAGGIARTASRSRECRPWRAGVLPGVPPAPSMAAGRGPGFKRTSPLDSWSRWRARLRWPAAPTGFVPQPLGLRASTALTAPGIASGFAVGPVTGLAGAPRWRLRPPPGQPPPLRPSLPQDAALVARTPRHPGLGGQV